MKEYKIQDRTFVSAPMTLRQRQHIVPLFKEIGEQNGTDEIRIVLSLLSSIEEKGLSNKIVSFIIKEKDKETSPGEIEKFLDELTYEEFNPEVLIADFFTNNKELVAKLITSLIPSHMLRGILAKNTKPNTSPNPVSSIPKSKTKRR